MKDFTPEQIHKAWSWVGALMPLGAAIISTMIGWLLGKLGRKGTMLTLVIPFTIGWALIIKPCGVCNTRFVFILMKDSIFKIL